MNATKRPNELYLSRLYHASVQDVWAAWTDVQQVAQWWGPRGFSITTHQKDLRPGGRWDYTMHGPDGTDYPNITSYLEVVEYQRLVYDHGATANTPPLFRVTVEWQEKNGKTQMEMTMAFASAELAAQIKVFIKQANGDSTWDRLAEYLEKRCHRRDVFIINRSFPCSIAKLYEHWANPELLSQWLAPQGFHMEFLSKNFKVGGRSTYRMVQDDGLIFFESMQYQEIIKDQKLVFRQDFRDANDRVSRHPLLSVWPPYLTATVSFFAEDKNQARFSVEWQAAPESKSKELSTFLEMKTTMMMGWTGSFDQLDLVLGA